MGYEGKNMDAMLKIYREGRITKKDLETFIFIYLQKHLPWYNLDRLSRDNCSDFISWLYPRISSAIERYQEKGSSFDTYMGALVRLSVKEYNQRQKDHRLIEKALWNAKAEETPFCEEEEPDYFEPKKQFGPVTNPRQVLVLLLKSYYYLSEDFLERIAPAVGMKKDQLMYMVDELRKKRLAREEAIRGLQERVHCQFYRCLAFEKRMTAASPYTAHGMQMKKSLDLARKRLGSMRKRLSRIRYEASNRQIAELLNISKGTVDSNLYEVKHHARNQMEKK
jgi:DNA-binding MarR family transcriptional regulator